MGSIQLPKTLSGWARYCDCLQNLQRFKIIQPQISETGQLQNEKSLQKAPSAHLKKKNNNVNDVTAQNFETPPPIKQQKGQKGKKQKHVQPLAIRQIDRQSQNISQFSEPKPQKQNIFDIVRIEEDEDINKAYNIYSSPFARTNQQRARTTAPQLSNNLLPNNDIPSNTLYTQPYQKKQDESYFLDDKDRAEYFNKLDYSKA